MELLIHTIDIVSITEEERNNIEVGTFTVRGWGCN